MKRLGSAVCRVVVMLAVAAAAGISVTGQNRRDWRDYGGSPDNSKFTHAQANQQVQRLAGSMSPGPTRTARRSSIQSSSRGVIYGKGRNSSLVALDAATGKEIWIHEGLEGMTRRGMNYWESKDGKDRRLIFSISDYLQEIDAATGKSIRHVRQRRRRRSARGARARSGDDRPHPVEHARQGLREPAHPRLGDRRSVLLAARAICAPTTSSRGKLVWSSTPCRIRANSATTPGRRMRGNTSAARTPGARSRSTPSAASRTFPTGSATFDFYGADRHGANLFANCLHRARRAHRQAPVALPERAPRSLGLRQHVGAAADDDQTERQVDSRRRDGGQDRVSLRLRSRDRRADLADRRAPGADEDRRAGRAGVADAAVSDDARRRSPGRSSRSDDINPYMLTPAEREQFKERIAAARNEGLFTPIGFSEVIHMPGNNGGSNLGSTSSNPSDGTVYVISYDIPAIMRLLTPQEAAARGGRGGGGGGSGRGRDSPCFSATARPATAPIAAGTPNGASLDRRRRTALGRGDALDGRERQGTHAAAATSHSDRCRRRRDVSCRRPTRPGAAARGRGAAAARGVPTGPRRRNPDQRWCGREAAAGAGAGSDRRRTRKESRLPPNGTR